MMSIGHTAVPACLAFFLSRTLLSKSSPGMGLRKTRRPAPFAAKIHPEWPSLIGLVGLGRVKAKRIVLRAVPVGWHQRLSNKTTRLAVRLGADDEYWRACVVARLYRLVHGRPFDVEGMLYALDALAQGASLATLVSEALASETFKQLGTPQPVTPDDIDAMFQANFDALPPVLPAETRKLPVAAYAARLLAIAESRTHTCLTHVLYPQGIRPDDGPAYRLWLRDHCAPAPSSRVADVAPAARLPSDIAISLVMVGDAWQQHEIAATVSALQQQTCDRYELIVVGSAGFCNHVATFAPAAVKLPVSVGNALAFNQGLKKCRGAFVYWIMPGVRLASDAVFHFATVLARDTGRSEAALLADCDGIDRAGNRCAPRFATGWDPETALCDDRWTQQILLRTGLARLAGGARAALGEHAWADLALRVITEAGETQVDHIPRPLLSIPLLARWTRWRRWWSARAQARSWSRLVEGHLALRAAASDSVAPRVVQIPGAPARILYPLPRETPLVSIVIPTRDKSDLLDTCLNGVLWRTAYAKLEVLIVDNRSVEPRTQTCLARYAADSRVRVLAFDRDFNWGAINNFAVRQSKGSVVLLLNNDTDVVDPGWLGELAAQAVRPEIGAVGPKLLYRNGTVQHAGLIFGSGAQSYHRFRHLPGDAAGYGDALRTVHQVSAVTGACLALRRSVYDEVGGIEEDLLAVTWSDVDLCFRVRERGYRVIYTPHAPLLHLELATRGPDTTPERAVRAERERDGMLARWPSLAGEDVHYNPNLQLGEGETRVTPVPRTACSSGFQRQTRLRSCPASSLSLASRAS
jgi:GT2 family glycosyltransferase